MIVPAVLVGLMLLAFAPSAGASSALDQYVEQVPDPGGSAPPTPKPTEPPSPAPRPEKPARTSSDPDAPGPVEPLGTATEPSSSAEASSGGTSENEPAKARQHRNGDHGSGQNEARGNALEGHDQPDRAAAWSKAAEASGINAPLAAFVVLLAAGMIGVTVRRRVRGGSR